MERSFQQAGPSVQRSLKEAGPALEKSIKEGVAPALEKSLKEAGPALEKSIKEGVAPALAKVKASTDRTPIPEPKQMAEGLWSKAKPAVSSVADSAAASARQVVETGVAQTGSAFNQAVVAPIASQYETLRPEERQALEASRAALERGGRQLTQLINAAAPVVDEGMRRVTPVVDRAVKATQRMSAQRLRAELSKAVADIDAFLLESDPSYVPPPVPSATPRPRIAEAPSLAPQPAPQPTTEPQPVQVASGLAEPELARTPVAAPGPSTMAADAWAGKPATLAVPMKVDSVAVMAAGLEEKRAAVAEAESRVAALQAQLEEVLQGAPGVTAGAALEQPA